MDNVTSKHIKKNFHKGKIEIKKSPVDMNYNELDDLLDSLLKLEGLPSNINYRSDTINYHRRSMIWIITKALYRLVRAEIFYLTYVRKRIGQLKKSKEIFNSLKKTGCLKSLRMYLHLSKIGLTDLLNHIGGSFNDKIFANFNIATSLYDAAFDVPECRKYLRDLDSIIVYSKNIETKDVYLALFNDCVGYLRNAMDKKSFDTFANYIKIEHISQLMSIYQLSDKKISKESLSKITFPKGGISLLALMHLMAPKMKEKQRKAIYELGAVLQLIDDIQDTKEDLRSGIQTLPNQKLLDHQDLKKLFFGAVNNLIYKCDINPNQANGSLDMLCWFADVLLERRYGSYLTTE
ncbi:MAG: class 1 isoprenoid biosynthesis enzyme [Thermoplasmatales archaeon]|nr:MAG: class 1 isoprenoid biosynthesis enzyme [Thermoplasmatales archaeon]